MISQKMKYALKALIAPADEGAGQAMRIEEIARGSGTPKRFLEQILLEIRNAGILSSVRRARGATCLPRTPRPCPWPTCCG